MNKRAIRAEDSALIFIIAFALYQTAGMIVGAIFPNGGDWYIFIAYLVPQIFYIATVAVYVRVVRAEFGFLPQKEKIVPLHYLFAAIIGIGLFFFALFPNYGVQLLFGKLGKNPTVTVPDMTKPLNIIAGLIIICMLPAIGEELVFRKLFCDGFSQYGKPVAIILSGVIFGLSHMNLAQTVHQVFMGCVLAYLYIKTENITLTSVIHFINNVLALYLGTLTGDDIWSNAKVLAISCAAGFVLLAAGIIYFMLKTPKLDKKRGVKPSIWIIGFIALIAAMWLIVALI